MGEKGKKASVINEVEEAAVHTLDGVQKVIGAAEQQVDKVAEPVRRGILKRFPTLFLLAVTFGFTAVVVGMEQLIFRSAFLEAHPSVLVLIGIVILGLTGTVYKKLG